VVGCGGYSAAHAYAFGSVKGVRLFFSSRTPAKAAATAKRLGGESAGTFARALSNPDIDGVVLSSPHDLHRSQALAAFAAGKGVLVEKPIADSVADARRMIRSARRRKAPFMVAENYAALPQLARLLTLLSRRRLGPIRGVDALAWRPFHPWGWRLKRKRMGGGILIDMGVHYLRFLQTAFGSVLRVRALKLERALRGMEGESDALVELDHDRGVRSRLDLSWSRPRVLPKPGLGRPGEKTERLAVHGREGSAVFDFNGDPRARRRAAVRIARGFCDHLRGAAPFVSPEQGLADLAAVEAAYRSGARGGRWETVRA
jgi:predicted dehydrogenase